MMRISWAGVIALTLSFMFPAQSQATNAINSVSIEKNTYSVGETVVWNIDATCTSGTVRRVSVSFIDPTGHYQGATTPRVNGVVPDSNTSKGQFLIPLRITADASPGKYIVQAIELSCTNAQSVAKWDEKLDSLSFTVLPDGLTPAATQPRLEVIEMTTSSERKVGDNISIRLIASNSGKINSIWVFLRNQEEGTEVYKLLTRYDSRISGPDTKRIDNTFDFQVGPDWPSGTWTVSKVEITGYAGIDLNTPWGADPNPTNSTSLFNRLVSIINIPGQSSWGQPASGSIAQADISKIKITVTNPDAALIIPPEISNVSLSKTDIKAGESFELTMDVDGKGGNIYAIFGSWSDKATSNKGGAGCSVKDLGSTPFLSKMNSVKLICKSSRTAEPGIYAMRQLSVYTTSCSGSIRDISSDGNQDCQSTPKQRSTNYSNAYGSVTVDSTPKSKTKLINPLAGLSYINIQAPGALVRPVLESTSATDSQIIFKYELDYDISCNYSSTTGDIKTDGMKGDGSVTVLELRPVTEVILYATCRSSDGQYVSFSDSEKTAYPGPPILPIIATTESELDSVKINFFDLDVEGYSYEIFASDGNVLVFANTVEISALKPNQRVDITIKITDAFGQVSEGKVATVKSLAPPILSKVKVNLVKSTKSSFTFKFNKLPELKYKLIAINCVAKINGDLIQITSLVKKKSASVTLVVSDAYKQTSSNKFFQYTTRIA
jgi:hypothetical protein